MIGEVGARDMPEIVVFNKADLVDDGRPAGAARARAARAIFASARTGEGIDELLAAIARCCPLPALEVDRVVPYDRGDLISPLHERGRVLSTEYEEEGTRINALVGDGERAALEPYLV